jgi:hypothetical protein
MSLLRIPTHLLTYILSFLNIQKNEINRVNITNKLLFNLTKRKIKMNCYPWNKNESYMSITLSYHDFRIQRKRALEIDIEKEYQDNIRMLEENFWI